MVVRGRSNEQSAASRRLIDFIVWSPDHRPEGVIHLGLGLSGHGIPVGMLIQDPALSLRSLTGVVAG